VRQIAAEGHTIGNHGWSHRSFPFLSSRDIETELGRCGMELESITGTRPSLVRPPYGRRDYRFYAIAKKLRLVPVFWSFDTLDWLRSDPQSVCRRVCRVGAGDIVLMHDGNRKAFATHDALLHLLEHLRRNEFGVDSLAALGDRFSPGCA
jgi:peptidoglycan/xylan/chitin deacetylase (PgdA/CDA1 family)